MKPNHFFQQNSYASSTSRGLISGLIGGLAGTVVKSMVEQFLPVRKINQRSAQIKILDDLSTKLTGTPISLSNEGIAEQLVNIPVGASLGAAYGYGKKDKDEYNISDGVILGASTWFSTHETSLPILGLEPKPTDVPVRMQINELLAHVLFGITTEVVRSAVNAKLKSGRII
jgi:putative membrane protein